MKDISDLFKALSSPWRVHIIKKLHQQGTMCMCELEPDVPIDKTTLSRHIQLLVRCGLIREEKSGTRKDLTLVDSELVDLIVAAENWVHKADSPAP